MNLVLVCRNYKNGKNGYRIKSLKTSIYDKNSEIVQFDFVKIKKPPPAVSKHGYRLINVPISR